MLIESIENLSSRLQKSGYLIQSDPKISGVQGLLYAHSPSPARLGFAKVEDHFLFIDWEYAAFSRMNLLLETYKRFSKFVNQGFLVPHALRIRIPNLAVVAVSCTAFPTDIIHFVQNTYLNPWYGGETGQLMLIDLKNKEVFSHKSPRFREQGSIPLSHSVDIITNSFLS
jgi:hypothetical protein